MDANLKEGPYNQDLKAAVRFLYGKGFIAKDKDIAAKTGYAKNTVSGYLSGKLNASSDFRTKFEEAFNLQLSRFTGSEQSVDAVGLTMTGDLYFVEVKTVSGKHLQIKPTDKNAIDLLNALLEERERNISEAEKRADKAEKEKERLYSIIEQNLTTLLKVTGQVDINSKAIADDLAALITEVQAEHRAIMDTVDKAAKQTIGTTRANAGTVEIASVEAHQKTGKKTAGSKQG